MRDPDLLPLAVKFTTAQQRSGLVRFSNDKRRNGGKLCQERKQRGNQWRVIIEVVDDLAY